MSVVTLVSGGLDSSLMAAIARQEGIYQHPVFIDYGQRNRGREWKACQQVHKELKLQRPTKVNFSDWGKQFRTGLTDPSKDIFLDAFTPNRNLLFLLIGSSVAYQKQASAVAIGLLSEQTHIFSDQTTSFLRAAEALLRVSLNYTVEIVAPLMQFSKRDVIALAMKYQLVNTYSCHAGRKKQCGRCISCLEFYYAT